MARKAKKRWEKASIKVIIILAVIAILLGILIVKKPDITGFVILSKETTNDDILNLVVNESKNITWNVRNPGALQSIKATGAITRNGTAKVYVKSDDKKVLLFDSTKQLFDVNIEVLPDYKRIFQGDEFLIQIVLFNLRGFGSADVNVKYSIKDPIGNVIAAEEEIISVETQAKFVRELLIPSDLKSGNYVAFVEVKTPDGLIGTSSDSFEVGAKFEPAYPVEVKYVGVGIAALVVLAVIVIFGKKLYKKSKKKSEIAEIKERIPKENAQKLKKELVALKDAYMSKFISKESYKRDKARIENKLKKLK